MIYIIVDGMTYTPCFGDMMFHNYIYKQNFSKKWNLFLIHLSAHRQ